MVGIGSALMLLALWLAWSAFRRRDIPKTPWFLKAVAVSGVGAILALWSGWIVTEVGRQPWIVYHYMKTSEAVTNANGIWGAFIFTLLLYAAIGTIAVFVLRRMSRRWREGGEGTAGDEPSPYSPEERGASV
jgi:cytochrome d ubiquinol oxidase subunit I